MPATVIALFNHKGGVSKTTTTFNLGWIFAEHGLKVLIVDADPQCNLTSLSLSIKEEKDLEEFYASKSNDNIYDLLSPLFKGESLEIKSATLAKTNHENLFVLAGNMRLSEIDVDLSFALLSNKALPYTLQFIGSFNYLVRETAKTNTIDIVLVDVSPSISALNRIILMGSDYFIIPTSPDFFCYQAIQSLSNLFPEWENKLSEYRRTSIKNPLPEKPPKFLGIISQKYRPRKSKGKEVDTTKAFQEWIDKIQETTKKNLVPNLEKVGMTFPNNLFRKYATFDKPYNLASIPDFNTLISKSQESNIPIFKLTKEDLQQGGIILENTQSNQRNFNYLFHCLASCVLGLIGLKEEYFSLYEKTKTLKDELDEEIRTREKLKKNKRNFLV